MKIGLLSDTHAYWDERYVKYFQGLDEIWHAGDIGSEELANQLAQIAPLRAVYGNIDGQALRTRFPKITFFTVAGVKVCMTHIGGYPAAVIRVVTPRASVRSWRNITRNCSSPATRIS